MRNGAHHPKSLADDNAGQSAGLLQQSTPTHAGWSDQNQTEHTMWVIGSKSQRDLATDGVAEKESLVNADGRTESCGPRGGLSDTQPAEPATRSTESGKIGRDGANTVGCEALQRDPIEIAREAEPTQNHQRWSGTG
jgi:hypothetical protein